MSITLDDFDVDSQTKSVLRVALERTRVSLGLTDDLADGIIAKQIIECAKAGEHNPDVLYEAASVFTATNTEIVAASGTAEFCRVAVMTSAVCTPKDPGDGSARSGHRGCPTRRARRVGLKGN
jgi:hypothetical protein